MTRVARGTGDSKIPDFMVISCSKFSSSELFDKSTSKKINMYINGEINNRCTHQQKKRQA